MENFIKTSLQTFINTIEVSFDYIPKKSIKNFNKQLKRDNKSLFADIYNVLHLYHDNIIKITTVKNKLKTIDFDFINSIALLSLNLNLFANENKATKKNLVNYIYNFYYPIYLQISGNVDHDFVKENQLVVIEQPKQQVTLIETNTNTPQQDVLQSLLGNTDLMNIANDIKEQISSQNIDPMTILTSLMAGSDGGEALQNLVNSVSKSVDEKMASGQLDQSALETQAKTVISSLGIDLDTTQELDASSITNLFSNLMKQG
jgi:hypothetical protein